MACSASPASSTDVTFDPVPDADSHAIEAGYRAKYGNSSHVDAMVTPTAAAATLRVVPHDKEQL